MALVTAPSPVLLQGLHEGFGAFARPTVSSVGVAREGIDSVMEIVQLVRMQLARDVAGHHCGNRYDVPSCV